MCVRKEDYADAMKYMKKNLAYKIAEYLLVNNYFIFTEQRQELPKDEIECLLSATLDARSPHVIEGVKYAN